MELIHDIRKDGVSKMDWERWRHKDDHTIVYEARRAESDDRYEIREPENGSNLGLVETEFFEETYERIGEES